MAKEPKTPKAKKERPPKPEHKVKNSAPKESHFILASLASKPWFKIVEIVFATLLLVMLVFYGAAMLFAEKSGFTIEVGDTKKDKAAISLSETEDFSSPTVRLDAGGIEQMTNISVLDLPTDLDTTGGAHGGENYIAYTFYVKNTGGAATALRSDMNITSVLKNADEAIRIRVYKNGQQTTYAKAAKDGKPEHDTLPFAEDRVVFSVTDEDFKPDEIIKYTFVIWLEGDDPECLDDIRGGNVKMSLTFSVVDEETS